MKKIIDAHIHFSKISSFSDAAAIAGVDYGAEGFRRECEECGVIGAVAMGVTETGFYGFPDCGSRVSMGCDLPNMPENVRVCSGVNPFLLNEGSIERVEDDLRRGAAGIKIYAGYYPFAPDHEIYEPLFYLAQKYSKPIVVHTGGTFSDRALVEYARPIYADRAAVRNPGVNIMLAHLSTPWVLESIEMAYKNKNVYLDMSGLTTGDEAEVDRVRKDPHLSGLFKQGLIYLNNYDKVLYGSDWPLAPMAPYIRLCESLIPENWREKVFCLNAKKLFGL